MALSPNSGLSARQTKPLLRVLAGERFDPPPMWLMRQAGRYLPEYRKLRQDKGSFLGIVCDSDAAAAQSSLVKADSRGFIISLAPVPRPSSAGAGAPRR